MISAVIFDFGGVMIDNPSEHMMHHYSSSLGVDKEVFLQLLFSKYIDRFQKGLLSEQHFWGEITTDLCVAAPNDGLWLEGFLYNQKHEMFALASELRTNGHKTGLLSNIEAPIMEFVKSQNYDHFDDYLYSCEVGLAKPEEEIYHLSAKRLKVSPHEAVFIDDRPENVHAAKKAGMKGIVFEHPQQVRSELKTLGVSII